VPVDFILFPPSNCILVFAIALPPSAQKYAGLQLLYGERGTAGGPPPKSRMEPEIPRSGEFAPYFWG
jgi:hypothetical protein